MGKEHYPSPLDDEVDIAPPPHDLLKLTQKIPTNTKVEDSVRVAHHDDRGAIDRDYFSRRADGGELEIDFAGLRCGHLCRVP